MSDEEPFKVTDRRGRAKDADPADSDAVSSPESRPATGSAETVSTGRASQARSSRAAAPDLQGLFVMFASSALISLGEAADPATGAMRVDLQQAQEAIDLLILLRDKTAGNRTDQESRLLEEILYDLQLRFVRISREHTAG